MKSSFNDVVLRLLDYWREQRCAVWQPHNVQVGAGTLNPATFLRVLGPEPWNVVYVEPSIRPDDGRFGNNPNRMQMHHQLQVILKPDPGDPQGLYLRSLEAIGIDMREHDVRFVEDNWESPALGAWGLGWEVWLDGQEVTQFTYFQQAGGLTVDPVAVELTYGLERIVLALQNKNSVWEIDFGGGLSYGDAFLDGEIEQCKYAFNEASVAELRGVYEAYEKEALRCFDAGLVMPAHDYNLKCSHLFNVLDTRGAVGVTERALFFRKMRNTARKVAGLYVAQREKKGFPLARLRPAVAEELPPAPTATAAPSGATEDFVLEIGSEELPAADAASARAQLADLATDLFRQHRLTHGEIRVAGTPRRLVLEVRSLLTKQPDLEEVVKGPAVSVAYDAAGKPTETAIRFAKGKGVPVEELTTVEGPKQKHVAAVVRRSGLPAIEVLSEALPGLVAALKFERSMRWNSSNVSYSRPIRWILALLGSQVVPFAYAGVRSGGGSRGLRPLGSPAIPIPHAREYEAAMGANGIVTDVEQRRSRILEGVRALAASEGGTISEAEDLLAEVADLVESPTPLLGHFEERFLALPPEILIAVMRKHQRYFPVRSSSGTLLPCFVTVRNGDAEHLDVVRRGNEHVLRARFSDAEFFYANDSGKKLEDLLPRLSGLTFQVKLGSMLDKAKRLERLAPRIAAVLGLPEEQMGRVRRAALLAKADLATEMVTEMTSLQGLMGERYARAGGEPEEVARAIGEQYLPVSATPVGLALAVSDRLDDLAGLFSIGLAPKGSNDPFALRRAALGIVGDLIANRVHFDLRTGLREAGACLPAVPGDPVIDEVLSFLRSRLEVLLRDRGYPASVVRAVVAEQAADPFGAEGAARELAEAVRAPGWVEILTAYARCVRIVRKSSGERTVRPAELELPVERALYDAWEVASRSRDGSAGGLVRSLAALVPAINAFFDGVLVMDERPAVRENRLALLQGIADLAKGIADLSCLEEF